MKFFQPPFYVLGDNHQLTAVVFVFKTLICCVFNKIYTKNHGFDVAIQIKCDFMFCFKRIV